MARIGFIVGLDFTEEMVNVILSKPQALSGFRGLGFRSLMARCSCLIEGTFGVQYMCCESGDFYASPEGLQVHQNAGKGSRGLLLLSTEQGIGFRHNPYTKYPSIRC